MEQPSKIERYISVIIDFITILIITILLMNSPSYPAKFIAILIPLVYFPILHTLLSRSIGDIVCGLKVVDQRGNKIGFRLALNRFFWVFKCAAVASLFTNLLFLLLIRISGKLNENTEVSFDYEGKSETYLVKAS